MKTTILKVSDHLGFPQKVGYLKPYFGTGDMQPATIPRKTPWTIDNKPEGIPTGWVIWSTKLYSNSSKYYNILNNDGSFIQEYVPDDQEDYLCSIEEKDQRFKCTRVVFVQEKGDCWRFAGVFVLDHEHTRPYVHVFKRVATEIKITLEDEPRIELLDYQG